MEMSHPGDGSGAVPALEALQTHLSLPADDEREQPRCARFTASLQHPAHILYLKLKKNHTFQAPVCVPAGRKSPRAISSSSEISKGESGLIKMGAVATLGASDFRAALY